MKITTSITHYVSFSEAEKVIQENFGKKFSIPEMEELGNDSTLALHVTGEIDSYEQEDFTNWINGNVNALKYQTRVLFDKMASVGIIPKGDYVVDICW